MNFTPILAHRYLQKQINEICKAIYVEKNLSEQFREEFTSLRKFKFLMEEVIQDMSTNMKTNI